MNMPPPQWPPPETDCTRRPSISDPGRAVAVPLPVLRGADRVHDALAQDLGQRPAEALQQAKASRLTRTSLYS